MRRTLLAPALSLLLVAIAACGDGDDNASTIKESTTTPDGSDTTATTARSGDLASGPNYVTTSGPSGAGCTPGEVTVLPAGWWAGEITKVEDSSIDFDVVCWYQDAAATEAARA